MGEYATYKGRSVKIGTCENLTDLRPEHVPLITGYSFGRRTLEQVRFRFPFPDEDGMEPGDLRGPGPRGDLDRAMHVAGVTWPEGMEPDHSSIFVSVDSMPGMYGDYHSKIRFSVPCPLGPDGEKVKALAPYGIHGLRTGTNIVQQRAWEGRLVLVCACPACGSRFRLPELADAAPVLDALLAQAEASGKEAARARARAESWMPCGDDENAQRRAAAELSDSRRHDRTANEALEVAKRITAGYTDPPEWVKVTAPAAVS